MEHSKKILSGAVFAGVLVAGGVAFADNEPSLEGAMPLHQASDLALNWVPGTIVEAELENEDGVTVWEIEIVDSNNQTMELVIDATSGKLLSQHLDDDQSAY